MSAPVVAAALAAAALAAGCGDDDGDATTTASATRADPGLRMWAEHGCGSCHALAAAGATGRLGPDLGQTMPGAPAAIIRRAIVDPSASASPGFGTGAMPEDYARRMSRRELDQLVAFLVQGTR